MAIGARKGGWPEKNPETNYFGGMATPLSTTAPGGDPRPGINENVPDNSDPGNPVGYSCVSRSGKKGKK